MAELSKQEDDSEYHHAIKIAHQTIANMQARLNQKEEVLKRYQHMLAKAREVLKRFVRNFFHFQVVLVYSLFSYS